MGLGLVTPPVTQIHPTPPITVVGEGREESLSLCPQCKNYDLSTRNSKNKRSFFMNSYELEGDSRDKKSYFLCNSLYYTLNTKRLQRQENSSFERVT